MRKETGPLVGLQALLDAAGSRFWKYKQMDMFGHADQRKQIVTVLPDCLVDAVAEHFPPEVVCDARGIDS